MGEKVRLKGSVGLVGNRFPTRGSLPFPCRGFLGERGAQTQVVLDSLISGLQH